MTTRIILLFLAANTLISLVIFIVAMVRNRRTALGCLFVSLFVPGIGPIMCLVMAFPFKKSHYAMDTEEVIRRLKMDQVEYVDNERLMSTVPANDALTLSSESDRREYLLGLLRQRDMESLRGILHQAVYNNDSEASHYAASAIMELQRVSFSNMEKAAKDYVPGPEGSYEAAIGYAVSIMLYLENSEVGQLENYTFRSRYETVMRDVLENHTEECTGNDYENMIGFLLRQGRLDEAWQYAEVYTEAEPMNESGYLLMMQAAYQQGDASRFAGAYNALRGSDTVLSPKGLETVRFWMVPTAEGGHA